MVEYTIVFDQENEDGFTSCNQGFEDFWSTDTYNTEVSIDPKHRGKEWFQGEAWCIKVFCIGDPWRPTDFGTRTRPHNDQYSLVSVSFYIILEYV